MLRDVALDAEVFSPGLPLLDVRLIWDTEPDDVNPVELSVAGGAKRAGSIAAPVGEHNLPLDMRPYRSNHVRSMIEALLSARMRPGCPRDD